MKTLINELNESSKIITSTVENLHFHNGYELIYVAEGSVCIEIDQIPHEACAPAVILLNPFEQHKIICADETYHRFFLVLNSETLELQIHPRLMAMLKNRPAGFSHVIPLSNQTSAKIGNIFSILMDEMRDIAPYKEKFMLNTVYNLLIILYRSKQAEDINYDERMILVQKFIDENYMSIENIQQIAENFYLSSGHLSRAFKAYSGYSPVEYLVNTRLYHAQQLLLNTPKRIGEICSAVGFKDINNFTRQFRTKFGSSPSAFREHNS